MKKVTTYGERDDELCRAISKMSINTDKIKLVAKCMHKQNLLPHQILDIRKSDKISEVSRSLGNKYYEKQEFIDAVKMYNKSLCFAVSPQNLGLAYANRSAVCFELKMYSACRKNIELAISHNYPVNKVEKLIKRAEKCLKMIAEGAETDDDQLMIYAEKLKLSHPPNSKLPYIADCLEVKTNAEYGRHVITNKRLLPGDIICVESPFSKILKPENKFINCYRCLDSNFLCLIPCMYATAVMFCSTECKDAAFSSTYKYKVDIVDELNEYPLSFRSAIETFLQALERCNEDIKKLRKITEENEKNSSATIFQLGDPNDPINAYKAIDALESHENKRDSFDQLNRCASVEKLLYVFTSYTSLSLLLSSVDDRDFFRNFLYKHSRIAANNLFGFGGGARIKEEYEKDATVGTGSFPFVSLFNHSCYENVCRLHGKNEIVLMVRRVIEPGEQLFVNYGGTACFGVDDKEARQKRTREGYFFECNCLACRNVITTDQMKSKIINQATIKAIEKIKMNLFKRDHDLAEEGFKKTCEIMTKNNGLFPCSEIFQLEHVLETYCLIFSMSKLLLHLYKWKSQSFIMESLMFSKQNDKS